MNAFCLIQDPILDHLRRLWPRRVQKVLWLSCCQKPGVSAVPASRIQGGESGKNVVSLLGSYAEASPVLKGLHREDHPSQLLHLPAGHYTNLWLPPTTYFKKPPTANFNADACLTPLTLFLVTNPRLPSALVPVPSALFPDYSAPQTSTKHPYTAPSCDILELDDDVHLARGRVGGGRRGRSRTLAIISDIWPFSESPYLACKGAILSCHS